MRDGQLEVIIIDTPNSSRSQPLISSLESDSRFCVRRLPACMLSTDLDVKGQNIPVDPRFFQFLHGRFMSPQEIGCSHSHNRARSLLADSIVGGVILEDDARIMDRDSFFDSANNFLRSHAGKSSVLSLNEFRSSRNSVIAKSGYQRLFGTPFLAVSYVITPAAAISLVNANQPIRNVSDWPRAKVKYFSLFEPLVVHSESQVKSTIDIDGKLNREGKAICKKLSDLFFISFFTSKPSSMSLSSYFIAVYWSRISWHLDAGIRRLLKVIYK